MISTPDREAAVALIEEAVHAGAHRARACTELGLTARTLERWTQGGAVKADGRPGASRPVPANKLSESERATVLAIVNTSRFASLPPTQIVPRLADEGRYLASESTVYRILREADQLQHRGRAKAPDCRPVPRQCASGPNELWSWDISYLPGPVQGIFYFLYLVLDVYSRKIVAHEVHEVECADKAAILIAQACARERIERPLILHQDNGSPMKASTFAAKLDQLGIHRSYSRPGVSDDNPYSESLFRTAKYRPAYPGAFATIDEARTWMLAFVRWYNTEHKHRNLKFVSPEERHAGKDAAIFAQRIKIYEQARSQHPERWSRNIRNWSLPSEVWLNRPADIAGTDPQREAA